MTDLNSTFNHALELLQIGRQNESIALLRSLSEIGHSGAIQIIAHIDSLQNLKNRFPVNPLSIIDNDQLNEQHQIPNLIGVFEKDILVNLSRLQTLNNGLIPNEVTELLIYLTITYLIEYKNKALDYLPIGVIEQVVIQIKEAFVNVYIDRGYGSYIIDEFEKVLKEKIWNPRIIEETETFMDKLDNRHFM